MRAPITKSLMMLGLASLVTFTACKKDDSTIADATIAITPSPTSTTITEGTQLTLTLEFTGNSDNKLKSYKVTSSQASSPIATGDLSGTSGSAIVKNTPTAGTVVYTVTLTSGKGDVTKSYTVTVTTGGGGSLVYIMSSDAPYMGNQVSAEPKFWSAKRQMQFNLSDAVGNTALQADADFAYCSRGDGNKLIAPSSQDATDIYSAQWGNSNPQGAAEKISNWTKRNATVFIKTTITQAQFNAVSDSADVAGMIQTARNANEPNLPSLNMEDKAVYLFKTEKGAYGLILASNPTGSVVGGSATAGEVQLIIKYQREQ